MHAFIFFGAVKMVLRPALGARADPNAEADIRVRLADPNGQIRLADPNGQKADEIAVRLGRPVGVALTAFISRHGEIKNNQNEIPNAAASAEPPNGVAGP